MFAVNRKLSSMQQQKKQHEVSSVHSTNMMTLNANSTEAGLTKKTKNNPLLQFSSQLSQNYKIKPPQHKENQLMINNVIC